MKNEIKKSELMGILKQGFNDIPEDVELEVTEDGKVYVFCPGFQQPDWMHGVHYMNSDATIEVYDLGDGCFEEDDEPCEWEYNSEE